MLNILREKAFFLFKCRSYSTSFQRYCLPFPLPLRVVHPLALSLSHSHLFLLLFPKMPSHMVMVHGDEEGTWWGRGAADDDEGGEAGGISRRHGDGELGSGVLLLAESKRSYGNTSHHRNYKVTPERSRASLLLPFANTKSFLSTPGVPRGCPATKIHK